MKNDEYDMVDGLLVTALNEDIGSGDITTASLIPENLVARARLVAKGKFVLAGMRYARHVFRLLDRDVSFREARKDGRLIRPGQVLAKIKGDARSLLAGERTALNLLQRMSGIATLTERYVKKTKGTGVKIMDTRKTVPGLRYFDKYAVRTGGGHNHRFGLFDGILIKDNHIAAAGGVRKAVKLARSGAHHMLKVEVEVKNLSQVRDALTAGADIIMLDNMSVNNMRKAVEIIRVSNRGIVIEASGNITLDNVAEIAKTGVHLISVGALTHSAAAADITMEFDFHS